MGCFDGSYSHSWLAANQRPPLGGISLGGLFSRAGGAIPGPPHLPPVYRGRRRLAGDGRNVRGALHPAAADEGRPGRRRGARAPVVVPTSDRTARIPAPVSCVRRTLVEESDLPFPESMAAAKIVKAWCPKFRGATGPVDRRSSILMDARATDYPIQPYHPTRPTSIPPYRSLPAYLL